MLKFSAYKLFKIKNHPKEKQYLTFLIVGGSKQVYFILFLVVRFCLHGFLVDERVCVWTSAGQFIHLLITKPSVISYHNKYRSRFKKGLRKI